MPPTKTPGRSVRCGSKRSFTLPGQREPARVALVPDVDRPAHRLRGVEHHAGRGRQPGAQLADRRGGSLVVEALEREPGDPERRSPDKRRVRALGLADERGEYRPAGRTPEPPLRPASAGARAGAAQSAVIVLDQLTAAGDLGRGAWPAAARRRRRSARAPRRSRRDQVRSSDSISRCECESAEASAPSSAASAGLDPEGDARARERMQADRHLQDQAERAERRREQLGEVIPGDVLDHLAARPRDGAVGERHGHADDQVARGPVAVAKRAGVAARHDAADRRRAVRSERRIEGQHLVGLGEPGLRRRPAARRHRAPRSGRPRCARPRR